MLVADGDGAASWTLKTLYTRFDLCFAEFHVRVVCVLLCPVQGICNSLPFICLRHVCESSSMTATSAEQGLASCADVCQDIGGDGYRVS